MGRAVASQRGRQQQGGPEKNKIKRIQAPPLFCPAVFQGSSSPSASFLRTKPSYKLAVTAASLTSHFFYSLPYFSISISHPCGTARREGSRSCSFACLIASCSNIAVRAAVSSQKSAKLLSFVALAVALAADHHYLKVLYLSLSPSTHSGYVSPVASRPQHVVTGTLAASETIQRFLLFPTNEVSKARWDNTRLSSLRSVAGNWLIPTLKQTPQLCFQASKLPGPHRGRPQKKNQLKN